MPGTANALGGVINAASCNVPLFLVAGRTPITEGELRAGKSQNIHWRQESRDQGNIVREFVKWDYEIRTNQNLAAVVSRAYKISMSEPRGPVYMTLPREWLFEAMESTQLLSPESLSPASKMQADQASLEKAADWLIASESPLIVTKYLGRNPEAVQYLIELAELLAIPVVQQLSYVNFPTDHPLNLGTQTTKYVRGSDVLFFIDTDVPWEPPNRNVLRDGREDHSPGTRSDVHRNSRLGFSRRSAGDRLLGSVAAGSDRDHQSEASIRRRGQYQDRRAAQENRGGA